MPKKKTHEEFVSEVERLFEGSYEFLTKYINKNSFIKTKHLMCNYVWEVRAGSLLKRLNNGKIVCPQCNNQIIGTTSSFKEKVNKLTDGEYVVLGTYINANTRVKMQHRLCKHIYGVTPANFIQGKVRCPDCSPSKKKDTYQFKIEVFNLEGNNYIVIGEYVNSSTKIAIQHAACGSKFESTPNSFLRGTRCPECAGNKKKTTEQFKQKVYDLEGDTYRVLGMYINNKTKIQMKHNICEKTYFVAPEKFIDGRRCPNCNYSNGEMKIMAWLERHNIKFKTQHTFNDCRYINELKFDFAIFRENTLICVIEFDGRQHFEPVDLFGGEQSFKSTILRDGIKNNYCEKNKIPIIRIPYWKENNIDSVLELNLKKYLNNLIL